MNKFWEDQLDAGYYDIVLTNGLRKKRGFNLIGITQRLKR